MDKLNISLDRMRTFVRVAERGNLSAVAREQNMGQSSVTRHLRELEEALGLSLLSRTTRRVTLTDEGQQYYTHCLQILRLVEQATEDLQTKKEEPKGTIRISCTAALGVLHICQLLFAFQKTYPEIHIDLSLTDERIDLVKEGVDIALRLGPLAESSMKQRHLGSSHRLLVASPDYLARYGRPKNVNDLSAQKMIVMSNIAGNDILSLQGPDERLHRIALQGNLRVDHGLAAREALVHGQGLGVAHHWLVHDLLQDGRLETVLPDHILPSIPLNMLIVPERATVARVRLLITYLSKEIKKLPGLEKA